MLQPVKTSVSNEIPVFQTVIETAMGGFVLDKTGYTDGTVIYAGHAFGFDEATRVAKPIKQATLHADATNVATTYQVKKGHNLVVGEYFAAVVGGKAYAITVIDTSNADYDAITVGTTLGVALTAGDVLFKSSATGASAAAYWVTPKGVLYEDATTGTTQDVAIVLRGTVYDRRIPKTNTAIKALMPHILYSQSY